MYLLKKGLLPFPIEHTAYAKVFFDIIIEDDHDDTFYKVSGPIDVEKLSAILDEVQETGSAGSIVIINREKDSYVKISVYQGEDGKMTLTQEKTSFVSAKSIMELGLGFIKERYRGLSMSQLEDLSGVLDYSGSGLLREAVEELAEEVAEREEVSSLEMYLRDEKIDAYSNMNIREFANAYDYASEDTFEEKIKELSDSFDLIIEKQEDEWTLSTE